MTKVKKEKASPNPRIDRALEKMMKLIEAEGETSPPLDDCVRVINSAIAWEKVKHNIKEEEPFNPDDL